MNLSNLIILVVLVILIVLLVLNLHVKYTHIIEIAFIPLILYIILIRTKTVTNIETFIIICIGTIVLHLTLHILLKHYGIIGYHEDGDGDRDGNEDAEITEEFSNKLDEFKNSDNAKKLKYGNRQKLHKKRKDKNSKKSKKNKKDKKGKEKFENSGNNEIVTIDGIKSDAVDYYNSFNQGIMKKKSKNTGESVDKFYFLKDKLFEILDL